MLNVKKVSELLAKNVDATLYPRMFLMSPNGTLIAYSTPVDIKELRDQAALISMAWKEHETALKDHSSGPLEGPSSSLETMTIEFQTNNLIIRAVQPKLLLVLVGSAPPHQNVFRITPESRRDKRYPEEAAQGVLGIQRKKLDAMTDYIRSDFDSTGFIMPDDSFP